MVRKVEDFLQGAVDGTSYPADEMNALDFKVLTQFLEGVDGEVEGRAAKALPRAVHRQLRRLIRGRLQESERQRLAELLRDRSEWTEILAREIKTARTAKN